MCIEKNDRTDGPEEVAKEEVSRNDATLPVRQAGTQRLIFDRSRLKNHASRSLTEDSKLATWPEGLLVIGIGNCGRADDGLGWAFLEQLEAENGEADIAYRYQLQIEDAELIADRSMVLFVDATEEVLPAGFEFRPCQPTPRFEYSSHALSPETITGLCRQLYNATPQAHVLAIQGLEWGLREGLSREGSKNLDRALQFFYEKMSR